MKYARFYNPIVSFLLRLGLPLGPQALLTVRGRNSGLLRTTPIALNPHGTGWLLVSVYGRVDWVRNLRAAGEAVVTMRRRTIPVTSQELTTDQAAPIVRDLLASLNPMVRPVIGSYFATDLSAPIEAWQDEARRHPVFILTPA
ncbi:MAG: nitroreductase family deazaflavin-dependent oxidoreductase [Acidimicrobiia bacterium]